MLLSALLAAVPGMGRRQVANTWWSLGRMGLALEPVSGGGLPLAAAGELLSATTSALLAALARSVSAMPPSEFAWSLWAVARCGVAFDSLPPALARLLVATACRLVPDMGTGELGVSLWALGRMKAPVAALPPQLIDLLFAGIETIASRADKGRAAGRAAAKSS